MPQYQCYAYQHPVYGPAMRIIASITNAAAPVVTTTFAHGYISGTIIRFDFPQSVGMPELNQQTFPITILSPTTFTIPVDTTLFQPFSIPMTGSPFVNICALSVPIGELNSQLNAAVVNQL